MTDMISTSIRLSPELRRRIKQAAHRCEMTQTEFITKALEAAVFNCVTVTRKAAGERV